MEEFNLVDYVGQFGVVDANRNYWLVRTMGGAYYEEYVNSGFVAIGYNEVSIQEVQLCASKENPQKELVALIKSKDIRYKNGTAINASYAASQLLQFCSKMKIHDIVVSPGRASDTIAIGVIKSSIKEVEPQSNLTGMCQFNKRFDIHWYGQYDRHKLNPYLQRAFNSQHIVNDANQYAEYIDGVISDYYIKGDREHLVLKVRSEESIPLDAFSVSRDILDLVMEFATEYSLPFSREDITMKICVQSPGDISISSKSKGALLIFGLIIYGINGGTFEVEELGMKMEGTGVLTQVSDFLDRKHKRDMEARKLDIIEKNLETLKVEDSQTIWRLFETVGTN